MNAEENGSYIFNINAFMENWGKGVLMSLIHYLANTTCFYFFNFCFIMLLIKYP
jgi:hypothetical protein